MLRTPKRVLHLPGEGSVDILGLKCDPMIIGSLVDGKRFLPLAIQVHHAVCDGYHMGAFVERLQEYVDGFHPMQ